MGLLDALIKMQNANKDEDEYSEEELDDYGLTDEEKDLVRSGEYEPWQFEVDDDLEEEDYYSEDDS